MSLWTQVVVAPWDPIDSYAELTVRLQVLRPERISMCNLREKLDPNRYNTSNCFLDQARLWRRLNDDIHGMDAVIHRTNQDLWDHRSVAKLEPPKSRKRFSHMMQAIPWADEKERRRWLYARLPPDALAQRREQARERWRKAAYLLGILCFWRHVASVPGSKAARAALARLGKRGRAP
jgi:hypothetical protein